MAGSRLAFERNGIQLHQILATRTADVRGVAATRCGTTSASDPPTHPADLG